MILSQIRRIFVWSVAVIFIAMDLQKWKILSKINRRRSYGKKLWKKREAQAVVIEEMRRTGKIIPRIGKTKSPLTH